MRNLKNYTAFTEEPTFIAAGADSATSPSEITGAKKAMEKWQSLSNAEKQKFLPSILKVITELSDKNKKVFIPKESIGDIKNILNFYSTDVIPFIKYRNKQSSVQQQTTNNKDGEGEFTKKDTPVIWRYNPRIGKFVSSTGETRYSDPNLKDKESEIAEKQQRITQQQKEDEDAREKIEQERRAAAAAKEKAAGFKNTANNAIRSAINKEKDSAEKKAAA